MEKGEETHRHVLVTGLSGTGKTYLSRFFRQKGKNAYDADEVNGLARWFDQNGKPKEPTKEEWSQLLGIRWMWEEKKLRELLTKNKEVYLFGMSDNMYDFLALFDKLYYLNADKKLILSRLQDETRNHDFGKSDAQKNAVLGWIDSSAEKARKAGFEFIDASLTPQQIFSIIDGET